MGNSVESVSSKLKDRLKRDDISLEETINLFCQEEFIRRLAASVYKDNLILKGDYLLYSISGLTRMATSNLDYLVANYSNNIEDIERLVKEIISLDHINSFIRFEIKGFETINKSKKYPGIRANLLGLIEKTSTSFSVDFGVGDIIIPSPVRRILPVLIPSFEEAEILTYSLESTVAEKLDAIMFSMEATAAMKDFYDIYYLARSFDFEGRKLQESIYETLTNRARSCEKDSLSSICRLAENEEVIKEWDNFSNKILKYELDFTQVLDVIIKFIGPAYEAIVKEDEFLKKWTYKDKKYN